MSKAIMELKTNEMNVASSKFDKSKNVGFFSFRFNYWGYSVPKSPD